MAGQTLDGLAGKAPEQEMTFQGDVVKVVNRTKEDFEWQHNGMVYQIKASGSLLCLQEVGLHGYHRSIVNLDPISNEATFKLGVDGLTDCSPLEPAPKGKVELLDRSSGMDKATVKEIVNPVGNERASGGGRAMAGPENLS
jgi:hypothetical protein